MLQVVEVDHGRKGQLNGNTGSQDRWHGIEAGESGDGTYYAWLICWVTCQRIHLSIMQQTGVYVGDGLLPVLYMPPNIAVKELLGTMEAL